MAIVYPIWGMISVATIVNSIILLYYLHVPRQPSGIDSTKGKLCLDNLRCTPAHVSTRQSAVAVMCSRRTICLGKALVISLVSCSINLNDETTLGPFLASVWIQCLKRSITWSVTTRSRSKRMAVVPSGYHWVNNLQSHEASLVEPSAPRNDPLFRGALITFTCIFINFVF